jgi:hypothetical protein
MPFSRPATHSVGVLLAGVIGAVMISAIQADGPRASESVDFERDAAKVLIVNCLSCHNASEPSGGLDLSQRAKVLQGGESGAAIVAHEPAKSLLIQRIRAGEMPPEESGKPLASEELIGLEAWIRQGALWPEDRNLNQYEYSTETRAGLDWWSLRPLKRPHLPATRGVWVRNPIDVFILDELQKHGLGPSPEADRITLIRRLKLDILGLPPTPEEIAYFRNDSAPDAYQRLVDRMLASPHYGERWGRHWLDVVRYADTGGYERNGERSTAWHYRDYVITAFNQDLSYDQFVIEQLAGDAVGARKATGFLVCAPFDDVTFRNRNALQRLQVRQDELHEFVNTTTQTFLGLVVACSRCHDHKFDPVSQRDYYALQAILSGIRHPERTLEHSPYRNERKTKRSAEERRKLIAQYEQEIKELPPAPLSERRMEVRSILVALQEKRSGKDLLTLPYAVFTSAPQEPTYRLHRGDPAQRKEVVDPAAIQSLGRRLEIDNDTSEQERRLALASWIVDPDNPLTARVMVNRIWQYHFGRALVDTPSNFGGSGSRPTHPRLLDWLAAKFMENGWSIKMMHRLIVNSATYRQSSRMTKTGFGTAHSVDADNRLLWRFSRRRLEAEAVRDSILFVAGTLDTRAGGPGYLTYRYPSDRKGTVRPIVPRDDLGSAEWRRMVYELRIRMEVDPTFGALDCPDGGTLRAKRTRSTTPIQALNLFNSRFVLAQAEQLAARIETESSSDPLCQVQWAFRLLCGRSPDAEELAACVALVREVGLAPFCRVVLNTNEFLFMP